MTVPPVWASLPACTHGSGSPGPGGAFPGGIVRRLREKLAQPTLLGFSILALALGQACTKEAVDRGVRPAAPKVPSQSSTATTSATNRKTPFKVGVLYWSSTIQGQVVMRKGLEAEAARINAAKEGPGIELEVRVAGDGDGGQRRQIQQMDDLLELGVDALIVQPTDNTALISGLKKANRLGIPVVAYDQYIEQGRLHAYITSDNRQAGLLDGEYIAHRFPDSKKIKLVLVEYPPVSSTVERLDGFLSALKAQGQPYEIVGTYKAVEPKSGKKAGQDILRDHPRGQVDVVFTVNDGGGLALVEVLAAAGRDEIVVATIDGDPKSVDNIKQGRLTVIDTAQFCGPMGAAAMATTYRVLLGRKVAAHQLIPTFPITKETLDSYPGWLGPLPARFKKPWKSDRPYWSPKIREVRAQ